MIFTDSSEIFAIGIFDWDAPVQIEEGTGPAPVATAKTLSGEQVWEHVYDPAVQALRVVDVGTASGNYGTQMDWRQILRHCLDPDSSALRVVFVSDSGTTGIIGRSMAHALKNSYDPTKQALRIVRGLIAVARSKKAGAESIIRLVYSANNHALRGVSVGSASGYTGQVKDWRHVIQASLSEAQGSLRYVT